MAVLPHWEAFRVFGENLHSLGGRRPTSHSARITANIVAGRSAKYFGSGKNLILRKTLSNSTCLNWGGRVRMLSSQSFFYFLTINCIGPEPLGFQNKRFSAIISHFKDPMKWFYKNNAMTKDWREKALRNKYILNK